LTFDTFSASDERFEGVETRQKEKSLAPKIRMLTKNPTQENFALHQLNQKHHKHHLMLPLDYVSGLSFRPAET
jgi:hypothetical protein